MTIASATLPRGRWLKRIGLSVVALLGLAVASRFLAGVVADRRDATLRERLRADGFAVRVEDLQPPPVPDAQNAALAWGQAMDALGAADSPRSSVFDWNDLGRFPPYKAKWHELADASAAGDAAAFALADGARRLTRCDWGTQYTPETVVRFDRRLNNARSLANRLSDSFERHRLRGEDATAVERLLAGLALADAVRAEPTLISQLVGNGIDAVACSAARPHVGQLRIAPAQLRELIDALLAPSASGGDDAFVRALATETTTALNLPTSMSGAEGWTIEPSLRRFRRAWVDEWADAARVARRAVERRSFGPAFADPALAERDATEAAAPVASGPARLRAMTYYDASLGSPRRMFLTEAAVRAQRDVLAIALAVRWHQLDHAGRFPDSFAALVPAYLPAVPSNPLSPRGVPYEYAILRGALPDGGDRPVVHVDMPDGARGAPTPLPEYELYYSLATRRDRSRGRCSDLTSWTPTQAMIDAADAVEAAR